MTRRQWIALCLTATLSATASAAFAAQKQKAGSKDGPARWKKAIAAFEQADEKSPPPKNAILFVGSSSIRRWNLNDSFPGLKTINRGFGGSEIADSVYYVQQLVLKHEPRIVVMYAGDNDIGRGKTPKRVHQDFRAFVKAVHAKLPKTRILFIAIKPSLKRWSLAGTMQQANKLIAADCAKNDRLEYINIFQPMLGKDGKPRPELFAKDGLHLNAEGYKLWASLLKPRLK